MKSSPDSPTEASSPAPSPARNESLTKRELCAYGVGIIGYQCPHTALGQLALPVLNVALGMSPVMVGLLLMVGRIFDALASLIVGSWSDNTRSRWGRRRPFILIGTLLTAIAYPAVWMVPSTWSHGMMAAYLFAAIVLLYLVFSLFGVPYLALAYELTPDTRERTRIQVWRSYLNIAFTLASGWTLWFCQLPQFPTLIDGARWLGIFVGVVILLCGMPPALFLREPYYHVASKTRAEPFWPAVWATFKNRPNLLLLLMINTLTLGIFTTDALGFYVLTYHVYAGDAAAAGRMIGLGTSLAAITGIVAIPAVNYAAKRLGKIHALSLCLWIYVAVCAAKWFLFSPAHPWTCMLVPVFVQFGALGFWVLVNSMKGDACDWDELHSGRRREGVYAAVGGLVTKISTALTYLLSGLVIQLVGFDAGKGNAQSPETILGLRLVFSLAPIVFLIVCLFFLSRYRLDERSMDMIRRRLEERRT